MKNGFNKLLPEICQEYPGIKFDFRYNEWETDFLRFFNSEVNYNISKSADTLSVSLHKGKKKYSFGLYNPDEIRLRQNIEQALLIIDKLPEDPDFVDLEDNKEIKESRLKKNNIEVVPLEKKLEILRKAAEAVKLFGFNIYGTFICNYEKNYIVNSNGVNKEMHNSPIMLELKAVSELNEVTVIESYGSEDISTFDVDAFISHLTAKVRIATKEIVDVEPESYEVILAPRCIAELLGYLVWGGMSAALYDRMSSYFQDKIGQKVFPETITITDDPKYPGIIDFDYNSDGHIYNRLPLIEKGVFKNFLVNNYYGHKTDLSKNGAEAECLVMEIGDKSLNEMLSGVKRGLYISNLHYMNFINVKETSVTGLTRDGTFLIENGEMKNVVNNLRFTIKIVDVISKISEIENKHYLIPSSDNYGEFSINSYAMPHVKVSAFKITSSTKTI